MPNLFQILRIAAGFAGKHAAGTVTTVAFTVVVSGVAYKVYQDAKTGDVVGAEQVVKTDVAVDDKQGALNMKVQGLDEKTAKADAEKAAKEAEEAKKAAEEAEKAKKDPEEALKAAKEAEEEAQKQQEEEEQKEENPDEAKDEKAEDEEDSDEEKEGSEEEDNFKEADDDGKSDIALEKGGGEGKDGTDGEGNGDETREDSADEDTDDKAGDETGVGNEDKKDGMQVDGQEVGKDGNPIEKSGEKEGDGNEGGETVGEGENKGTEQTDETETKENEEKDLKKEETEVEESKEFEDKKEVPQDTVEGKPQTTSEGTPHTDEGNRQYEFERNFGNARNAAPAWRTARNKWREKFRNMSEVRMSLSALKAVGTNREPGLVWAMKEAANAGTEDGSIRDSKVTSLRFSDLSENDQTLEYIGRGIYGIIFDNCHDLPGQGFIDIDIGFDPYKHDGKALKGILKHASAVYENGCFRAMRDRDFSYPNTFGIDGSMFCFSRSSEARESSTERITRELKERFARNDGNVAAREIDALGIRTVTELALAESRLAQLGTPLWLNKDQREELVGIFADMCRGSSRKNLKVFVNNVPEGFEERVNRSQSGQFKVKIEKRGGSSGGTIVSLVDWKADEAERRDLESQVRIISCRLDLKVRLEAVRKNNAPVAGITFDGAQKKIGLGEKDAGWLIQLDDKFLMSFKDYTFEVPADPWRIAFVAARGWRINPNLGKNAVGDGDVAMALEASLKKDGTFVFRMDKKVPACCCSFWSADMLLSKEEAESKDESFSVRYPNYGLRVPFIFPYRYVNDNAANHEDFQIVTNRLEEKDCPKSVQRRLNTFFGNDARDVVVLEGFCGYNPAAYAKKANDGQRCYDMHTWLMDTMWASKVERKEVNLPDGSKKTEVKLEKEFRRLVTGQTFKYSGNDYASEELLKGGACNYHYSNGDALSGSEWLFTIPTGVQKDLWFVSTYDPTGINAGDGNMSFNRFKKAIVIHWTFEPFSDEDYLARVSEERNNLPLFVPQFTEKRVSGNFRKAVGDLFAGWKSAKEAVEHVSGARYEAVEINGILRKLFLGAKEASLTVPAGDAGKAVFGAILSEAKSVGFEGTLKLKFSEKIAPGEDGKNFITDKISALGNADFKSVPEFDLKAFGSGEKEKLADLLADVWNSKRNDDPQGKVDLRFAMKLGPAKVVQSKFNEAFGKTRLDDFTIVRVTEDGETRYRLSYAGAVKDKTPAETVLETCETEEPGTDGKDKHDEEVRKQFEDGLRSTSLTIGAEDVATLGGLDEILKNVLRKGSKVEELKLVGYVPIDEIRNAAEKICRGGFGTDGKLKYLQVDGPVSDAFDVNWESGLWRNVTELMNEANGNPSGRLVFETPETYRRKLLFDLKNELRGKEACVGGFRYDSVLGKRKVLETAFDTAITKREVVVSLTLNTDADVEEAITVLREIGSWGDDRRNNKVALYPVGHKYSETDRILRRVNNCQFVRRGLKTVRRAVPGFGGNLTLFEFRNDPEETTRVAARERYAGEVAPQAGEDARALSVLIALGKIDRTDDLDARANKVKALNTKILGRHAELERDAGGFTSLEGAYANNTAWDDVSFGRASNTLGCFIAVFDGGNLTIYTPYCKAHDDMIKTTVNEAVKVLRRSDLDRMICIVKNGEAYRPCFDKAPLGAFLDDTAAAGRIKFLEEQRKSGTVTVDLKRTVPVTDGDGYREQVGTVSEEKAVACRAVNGLWNLRCLLDPRGFLTDYFKAPDNGRVAVLEVNAFENPKAFFEALRMMCAERRDAGRWIKFQIGGFVDDARRGYPENRLDLDAETFLVHEGDGWLRFANDDERKRLEDFRAEIDTGGDESAFARSERRMKEFLGRLATAKEERKRTALAALDEAQKQALRDGFNGVGNEEVEISDGLTEAFGRTKAELCAEAIRLGKKAVTADFKDTAEFMGALRAMTEAIALGGDAKCKLKVSNVGDLWNGLSAEQRRKVAQKEKELREAHEIGRYDRMLDVSLRLSLKALCGGMQCNGVKLTVDGNEIKFEKVAEKTAEQIMREKEDDAKQRLDDLEDGNIVPSDVFGILASRDIFAYVYGKPVIVNPATASVFDTDRFVADLVATYDASGLPAFGIKALGDIKTKLDTAFAGKNVVWEDNGSGVLFAKVLAPEPPKKETGIKTDDQDDPLRDNARSMTFSEAEGAVRIDVKDIGDNYGNLQVAVGRVLGEKGGGKILLTGFVGDAWKRLAAYVITENAAYGTKKPWELGIAGGGIVTEEQIRDLSAGRKLKEYGEDRNAPAYSDGTESDFVREFAQEKDAKGTLWFRFGDSDAYAERIGYKYDNSDGAVYDSLNTLGTLRDTRYAAYLAQPRGEHEMLMAKRYYKVVVDDFRKTFGDDGFNLFRSIHTDEYVFDFKRVPIVYLPLAAQRGWGIEVTDADGFRCFNEEQRGQRLRPFSVSGAVVVSENGTPCPVFAVMAGEDGLSDKLAAFVTVPDGEKTYTVKLKPDGSEREITARPGTFEKIEIKGVGADAVDTTVYLLFVRSNDELKKTLEAIPAVCSYDALKRSVVRSALNVATARSGKVCEDFSNSSDELFDLVQFLPFIRVRKDWSFDGSQIPEDWRRAVYGLFASLNMGGTYWGRWSGNVRDEMTRFADSFNANRSLKDGLLRVCKSSSDSCFLSEMREPVELNGKVIDPEALAWLEGNGHLRDEDLRTRLGNITDLRFGDLSPSADLIKNLLLDFPRLTVWCGKKPSDEVLNALDGVRVLDAGGDGKAFRSLKEIEDLGRELSEKIKEEVFAYDAHMSNFLSDKVIRKVCSAASKVKYLDGFSGNGQELKSFADFMRFGIPNGNFIGIRTAGEPRKVGYTVAVQDESGTTTYYPKNRSKERARAIRYRLTKCNTNREDIRDVFDELLKNYYTDWILSYGISVVTNWRVRHESIVDAKEEDRFIAVLKEICAGDYAKNKGVTISVAAKNDNGSKNARNAFLIDVVGKVNGSLSHWAGLKVALNNNTLSFVDNGAAGRECKSPAEALAVGVGRIDRFLNSVDVVAPMKELAKKLAKNIPHLLSATPEEARTNPPASVPYGGNNPTADTCAEELGRWCVALKAFAVVLEDGDTVQDAGTVSFYSPYVSGADFGSKAISLRNVPFNEAAKYFSQSMFDKAVILKHSANRAKWTLLSAADRKSFIERFFAEGAVGELPFAQNDPDTQVKSIPALGADGIETGELRNLTNADANVMTCVLNSDGIPGMAWMFNPRVMAERAIRQKHKADGEGGNAKTYVLSCDPNASFADDFLKALTEVSDEKAAWANDGRFWISCNVPNAMSALSFGYDPYGKTFVAAPLGTEGGAWLRFANAAELSVRDTQVEDAFGNKVRNGGSAYRLREVLEADRRTKREEAKKKTAEDERKRRLDGLKRAFEAGGTIEVTNDLTEAIGATDVLDVVKKAAEAGSKVTTLKVSFETCEEFLKAWDGCAEAAKNGGNKDLKLEVSDIRDAGVLTAGDGMYGADYAEKRNAGTFNDPVTYLVGRQAARGGFKVERSGKTVWLGDPVADEAAARVAAVKTKFTEAFVDELLERINIGEHSAEEQKDYKAKLREKLLGDWGDKAIVKDEAHSVLKPGLDALDVEASVTDDILNRSANNLKNFFGGLYVPKADDYESEDGGAFAGVDAQAWVRGGAAETAFREFLYYLQNGTNSDCCGSLKSLYGQVRRRAAEYFIPKVCDGLILAVLTDRRDIDPQEKDDPIMYPEEKRNEDRSKAKELREKAVERIKNDSDFTEEKRNADNAVRLKYEGLLSTFGADVDGTMLANPVNGVQPAELPWVAEALAALNGDGKPVFIFFEQDEGEIAVYGFDPALGRFKYIGGKARFRGIFGSLGAEDLKHVTVVRDSWRGGYAALKDEARKAIVASLNSDAEVSVRDVADEDGELNTTDCGPGQALFEWGARIPGREIKPGDIIAGCYAQESSGIMKRLILSEWKGDDGGGNLKAALQDVGKHGGERNTALVLTFGGTTEVPQAFIDDVNAGLNGDGDKKVKLGNDKISIVFEDVAGDPPNPPGGGGFACEFGPIDADTGWTVPTDETVNGLLVAILEGRTNADVFVNRVKEEKIEKLDLDHEVLKGKQAALKKLVVAVLRGCPETKAVAVPEDVWQGVKPVSFSIRSVSYRVGSGAYFEVTQKVSDPNDPFGTQVPGTNGIRELNEGFAYGRLFGEFNLKEASAERKIKEQEVRLSSLERMKAFERKRTEGFRANPDGSLVVTDWVKKEYADKDTYTFLQDIEAGGIRKVDLTKFEDGGAKLDTERLSAREFWTFTVRADRKPELDTKAASGRVRILASNVDTVTFVPLPDLVPNSDGSLKADAETKRLVSEFFPEFMTQFVRKRAGNPVNLAAFGTELTGALRTANDLNAFRKEDFCDVGFTFPNTVDLAAFAATWNAGHQTGEGKGSFELKWNSGTHTLTVLPRLVPPSALTSAAFIVYLRETPAGYHETRLERMKKTLKEVAQSTIADGVFKTTVLNAIDSLATDAAIFRYSKQLKKGGLFGGKRYHRKDDTSKSFIREANKDFLQRLCGGCLTEEQRGCLFRLFHIAGELKKLDDDFRADEVKSLLLHFLCHPKMNLENFPDDPAKDTVSTWLVAELGLDK